MVERNRTAWFGWVTFAAVMLVVLGLLNVLEGLVALLQNQVAFIDGGSLVVVDITGLGVVMVVFGGLLIAAGIGLMTRNRVARIVAIAVVALHFLTQVGSLGAYPVWSLLMITIDVIILFALTVHWADVPAPIEALQPPPSGSHRADRDLQQAGGGFPMNAPPSPTGPARDVPAHAAHDAPPQPSHEHEHDQSQPSQSSYQQPSAYQSPQSGYQQQQQQTQPGPNAGPYPPGRPGSPAHAAPTSGSHAAPTSGGYGTGAI